jgi:hypothetical protein
MIHESFMPDHTHPNSQLQAKHAQVPYEVLCDVTLYRFDSLVTTSCPPQLQNSYKHLSIYIDQA